MLANAQPDGARLLGTFLRAHRTHLAPETVGIAPSRTRRTPGLRREEVAALAGVGVAWYTWLEQGRVQASKQVLEAIGRALRLGHGSFRYMLELGGYAPRGTETGNGTDCQASPASREHARFIVEDWRHGPAFVLDRWFDIVAWNQSYEVIWQDPRAQPNFMIALAASGAVGTRLGTEHRTVLRQHLPRFRAQTAAHRAVARVDEIYLELERSTPDLADWWICQSMDAASQIEFTIRLGDSMIRLSQAFLRISESSLTIVLQRAESETDALALAAFCRRPT
ncbi:Helix-turn-helix domain-containing protein [Enhydrobacter aerosaccus]|uniref:Helix-turn-helix domain-containing protein n=1 Tax=Enhydrobacter aerosaccus TaxID=225324 RepID=A0A1T4MSC1_9HYPH|nr:helix-turn-helix domain-containing protein [Enhydrobacter aerosaccus]SJZ69736.1 Helix-turn-helix domain-containing protein [Enhydrobacter aerosaccus]